MIAGLSDSAVSSILEIEAWINGEEFIGSRDTSEEMSTHSQVSGSQITLTKLESDLIAAVIHQNPASVAKLVSQLYTYAEEDRTSAITTVFLRTISDAPIESLKFLIATGLVDTARTDEITDRGCLHEAAIAGRLDVLQLCMDHGNDLFPCG